MTLPSFLVIGAMKCGTTTLHHDLSCHPDIFLSEKESNFLSSPAAKGARAAASYAALYQSAQPQQCCGEVSTEYSMLPDVTDVPELAKKLLGQGTKIIYFVREPVSRAVSHHYHMHSWHGPGKMDRDIDACTKEYPSIINYGRYAMQLQPWRENFGDTAVRVVVFEEYIKDRSSTINHLCQFLGLSDLPQPLNPTSIHNRSEGKLVLNAFWGRICKSDLYLQTIRSKLPGSLKRQLKRLLLPTAPSRPAPPSLGTVNWILDQTAEDTADLVNFLNRKISAWEPQQVLKTYSHMNESTLESTDEIAYKAA